MRAVVDEHYPHCVFLAEVNQWPEDVRDYFSDGDECQMAYHFPLMPRMYMAIAQEDRHPIVDIMRQTPDIPENCQWAIFLRNHDELTLEMVTDKERDYMYQMYVGDPRARVNVGIRRRLAPLMDNEIDKIKLMNSLLLSMPGSPIIYYGDEIGMGDNFFLGDRNGVRTPMQWSPDRNAGFSRADPQRLYLPPIMDTVYGYESVNVEAQLRGRASLLNWMQRVLALRKNHQAFGRGKLVFLHPRNRKILAYFRLYEDDVILCVTNLSRAAQAVELDLSAYKGFVPVELMGRAAFPPIGELPYLLTLPGHNYYWFKLSSGEKAPAWHQEFLPPEDTPTLVLFEGWRSFFHDRVVPWRGAMADQVRKQLEVDALPRFVAAQRWYGGKGKVVQRVVISDYAELVTEDYKWLLALSRIESEASEQLTCFLPLSLAWDNNDEERLHMMSSTTVARVRQQSRTGIISDAFADAAFCRAVVQGISLGQSLTCELGIIGFLPTDAFAAMDSEVFTQLPVRPPATLGSNTAVILGEKLFLKGYRHLQSGTHPEFEIGRFLTDVAHFPNTAPVFGVVEYQGKDGNNVTLALLQGYVENQGDGWSYTLDYLERFLEEYRTPVEVDKTAVKIHDAYLVLISTLGQRTGELHAALAQVTGDTVFDPEPVSDTELANWVLHVQAEATITLDQLEHRLEGLSETLQSTAKTLLAQRKVIMERLNTCISGQLKVFKTRYHGDYHLGQVLLSQNDFVLTDFEGEPLRPFSERCLKHSPLRDVASMLRSFNYAADTVLIKACAEKPSDLAKFEPLVRSWEAEVGQAFIVAYELAAHSSGLAGTDISQHGLLDLFLLEKALYELRYELNNRLDRVAIPLHGILSLLQHAI